MSNPSEIRKLSETIGAEIIGHDFTRPASDEAVSTWHDVLDEHQLLVFRDAVLSPEQQVACLETLGPALIENEIGRAYQFVSNTHEEGILGDESFAFHSDHAFMPDPIEFISLYGLNIPGNGTQTRFANGLAAAQALPNPLREKVGKLRARHIIDPTASSGAIPLRGPRLAAELPHAYHPILMPLRGSEKTTLYVSAQQTDLVEGLPESESRELIEALFDHLYDPRFVYTHEWRPGDLVIWDNQALQHARDRVPADVSRTLRRVSVGGTSVYAFFKEHPKWKFD